jgi:hypothetical protein
MSRGTGLLSEVLAGVANACANGLLSLLFFDGLGTRSCRLGDLRLREPDLGRFTELC